jgi:hypothetical protein
VTGATQVLTLLLLSITVSVIFTGAEMLLQLNVEGLTYIVSIPQASELPALIVVDSTVAIPKVFTKTEAL